ncbi:MAG: hypothetical protein RBT51_11530 [Ectothiorhodospiraceae bacterium]|jgi:hypothetical protein|nr:hypothetical protein [Ectothiorhodospiraceae bacterium]
MSKPATPSPEALNEQAWALFRKGDMRAAEQYATEAVRRSPELGRVCPLPEIWSLNAFYLARTGRVAEARKMFGYVLENRPDDLYAQEGYLLTLREEFAQRGEGRRGRLLLGVGTGRSGSTTLAKLWEAQEDCYSSHEHPPRLAWGGSRPRFEFHRRRFDLLRSAFGFVADVSHWWLPYLDELIDAMPDLRVVALRRERAATVASFLKVKGGRIQGGINHWMAHDGSFWTRNAWDECYPDYDDEDVADAVGRYWDDYYAAVDALMQRRPDNIRIVPTEELGSDDVQRELLGFCGFERPKLLGDLRLNQGAALDGQHMY